MDPVTSIMIHFPLPSLDLLPWLEGQTLFPKVYWEAKGGSEIRIALGKSLCFTHIPHVAPNPACNLRFYGGIDFFSLQKPHMRKGTDWQGFEETAFWLPLYELVATPSQSYLISHTISYRAEGATHYSVSLQSQNLLPPIPSRTSLKKIPEYPDWESKVHRALGSIQSREIDKIVLAQKTHIEMEGDISPYALLSAIKQTGGERTCFAFQPSPGLCFLGATPETLFKREGNTLRTEAVAGTRPRGESEEEDLRLENELKENPKEQKEFGFVKQFIHDQLLCFSDSLEWESQDSILKTPYVQHIHNRLTASLKEGISDRDILHALHPTPRPRWVPKRKEPRAFVHT